MTSSAARLPVLFRRPNARWPLHAALPSIHIYRRRLLGARSPRASTATAAEPTRSAILPRQHPRPPAAIHATPGAPPNPNYRANARIAACDPAQYPPGLAALRPVVTDMYFPCQRLTVGLPAGGFPVPEPHTSLALASTVRLLGGLCALDAFPFGRTVVIEEPPQRLRNHGPGPEPRLGTAVRNGRAHFSASLINENTPSSELAGPVRLLQLSPCPDITAPSAPVLLAACRY